MSRAGTIKSLTETAVRNQTCLAVLQVLKEIGLKGLTISQVAKTAHIAAGTVYNYFKNKDDLLVNAAVMLFEMIWRKQTEAVAQYACPKDKLAAFVEATFLFLSENIAIFNFLDQAQTYLKMDLKDMTDHLEKEIAVLESILQQGIQEGQFAPCNARRTAEFFHRSMVGVLCVNPKLGQFEPRAQAADLTQMWLEWLVKRDFR